MINDSRIGLAISRKKRIKRLQNRCEQLSKQSTKLKYPVCPCGCGTVGTDWAHGFSRRFEQVKYHPKNTFQLCREFHRKIDSKPELKREFHIQQIGIVNYNFVLALVNVIQKPTEQLYLDMIQTLEREIREYESTNY